MQRSVSPRVALPSEATRFLEVPMEGHSSLEWTPAAPAASGQPTEPDHGEASGPPVGSTLGSEAPACRLGAEGRAESTCVDVSPSNGLQGLQVALSSCGADGPTKAPPPRSQDLPVPPDRSVSGSSTCSSLGGSSQESDEVFSDTEEKSPPGKKHILRKTKSWKTFFTMVHWSLRRRSSWVQLAGHEGNFKPSEGGQILKKFNAVEDACLAELMSDVLHPFVPTYHGVVELGSDCYIQMDDLLRGLDMPSIMDCKMGTRTYLEDELWRAQQQPAARRDLYQKMVKVDLSAPTAQEHHQGAVTKPRYMQWREGISSSALLGFRIEGVTIEGGAVQRDFKRTRTKEEIVETFLMFTKSRPDILSRYLARLGSLRKALEESTFFKTHEVIGSSLLFLHDRKGQASVWMIDFGKTLPMPANVLLHHDVAWIHGNHEDGYLIGLQHLTGTMQAALRKAAAQGQETVPADS
ncbi:inositol-trisphosphate 3-kinase B-like [Rhineura floridana]|uniref:inositol-trisphosphate 3-kinase B-like n=1 Tax=Rhineura floridana TaxID=261503 RepID=UPI002AC84755|nr:inositol-trisphosphate 3-kinase B-like [Rhineura floridana]